MIISKESYDAMVEDTKRMVHNIKQAQKGERGRIIKALEDKAKKKYEEMSKAGLKITCLCDKPKWHLVSLNIDEIKAVIISSSKKQGGKN